MTRIGITSLPAWECGLKSDLRYPREPLSEVTPCVGVWIEIARQVIYIHNESVTPCVGVWIEIGERF